MDYVEYDTDRIRMANQWNIDNNMIIITKSDTEAELEKKLNDWNMMTYDQKKASDFRCIEIFNKTNLELYATLKSYFLLNTKVEDPIETVIMSENLAEKAKRWSIDNTIAIIGKPSNEDELNKNFNDWNGMTPEQQQLSDAKSEELFGKNNLDIYNDLKSHYLKKEVDNKIITTIDANESTIEKECNTLINISSINELASRCFKLSSYGKLSFYDKTKIEKTLEELTSSLQQSISFDTIYSDVPFFSPSEMIDFGIFSGENNCYSDTSDNDTIADNITSKDWFNNYQYNYSGINTENDKKFTVEWIHRLLELNHDYEDILKEGNINKIRARQQSILELGWHPDIPFTPENRVKAKNRCLNILKENYTKKFINLTSFIDSNMDNTIMEASAIKKIYPVFIVLVSGTSLFSGAIKKYTRVPYSHASIGLDSSLKELYSFNVAYGGGFTHESIDMYNKEQDITVFTIFVNKKAKEKIENNIRNFETSKNKTKYSFLNVLALPLNISVNIDLKMICSQFVDSILKLSEIDIVDKASSLVTPGDFYKSYINNDNIYKIYEGPNKNYNKERMDKYLSAMSSDVKYIKEFASIVSEATYLQAISENTNSLTNLMALDEKADELKGTNKMIYEQLIKPYIKIQTISEAKEFPVQFSDEGDLLIQKSFNIDFENEYSSSHKLLMIYEDNNNIEGMKYELSKLWYMNIVLEKKLYKKTTKDKQPYNKVRARILNDFNKYLKFVSEKDNTFNFTAYYNDTPFSDATIKIKGSTLKYTLKLVKDTLLM